MSDIWLAVAIGVAVPVVLLLGPYAWMLLPRYREPKVSGEEFIRMARELGDHAAEGLRVGVNPVHDERAAVDWMLGKITHEEYERINEAGGYIRKLTPDEVREWDNAMRFPGEDDDD